ncbi:dehydrogenase [Sphingomonas metalli]|uniref:Dehydrogenase n=1 Tax=Sphingomonas metalli TaxID=1779358 RepID=A0A916TE04_9SPHN|nr:PQQ-dependent sugar dehydrogenase [Sphingomonas metalli]GGB40433.1 dehydrogenase [Sphingomonas metalli]
MRHRPRHRRLALLMAGAALLAGCGRTQQPARSAAEPAEPVNYGSARPMATKPFRTEAIASFEDPWALTFIADDRMLVTEKPGALWIVTKAGRKIPVSGVPRVHYEGQGGLLFVIASPHFAQDHRIYLTYAEPGEGGDGLALARATLVDRGDTAALTGVEVLWRQLPRGAGGQFGGYIAFSPDQRFLFLTVGERQRFTPAQDPDQALGKILRLTLDGAPAPGNPGAGRQGATRIGLIDPPEDTQAAAGAKVRTVAMPGPNLTPAETWVSGLRNPYGLAFDDQGRLWETEMGPKGGDELNLIEAGANYGWPLVSYGDNYDGKPIPRPATRPEFRQPELYWNPVIAPAGFTFYKGAMFPEWRGTAFVGGLGSSTLVQLGFDGDHPREIARWDMDARTRFVLTGPDGALWLLEDGSGGRLLRLSSRRSG